MENQREKKKCDENTKKLWLRRHQWIWWQTQDGVSTSNWLWHETMNGNFFYIDVWMLFSCYLLALVDGFSRQIICTRHSSGVWVLLQALKCHEFFHEFYWQKNTRRKVHRKKGRLVILGGVLIVCCYGLMFFIFKNAMELFFI